MHQGLSTITHAYYRLLTTLYQLSSHEDDEHMCSAQVHACGEVSYSTPITAGSEPPPAL